MKEKLDLAYLQRVLPPSQPIKRIHYIGVDSKQLRQLITTQLDSDNPGFHDNLNHFIQLMEKIRSAVQFNLGLSLIERESHESKHPIWVKKGKPDFPVEHDGEIKHQNILYNSVNLNTLKSTPKVLIIKDSSSKDDEGFSILYQTKFRSFSLHLSPDGTVVSSLKLNWQKIYDDLSPDIPGKQQPLRSFTPWQRHSESNFFNARSTEKILTYLVSSFPSIFAYDTKGYYRDTCSKPLELTKTNINDKSTLSDPNLYITLDSSLIKPAQEFIGSSQHQPILAVVRRKSPLLGNLIQLVPALYRDEQLHLVLHGHQHETEIQEVFSCNFEDEELHVWEWQGKPVILKSDSQHETAVWNSLHLLKNSEHRELTQYTSAAPMVRGSDPVLRKYWLSSFDIATVYSEMITISDIFNMCDDATQTPRNILEQLYYSDMATSSFRRLLCSEYELMQAEHFAFQVVLPHESLNESFFWGKNGEHISRTALMAIKIIFKMAPAEYHHKLRFAINMCCPAAAIEKIGGGFGLCNKSEYLEGIIRSIKDVYPDLHIEFKTLMLSDESELYKISFEKNKYLSEFLSATGADSLVWQGKPRNEEVYDLQTVLNITKASQVGTHFKFGYSGMVTTLKENDLLKLGYKEVGQPHYSVENILNSVKKMNHGVIPDGFEVMLGRVLLGSSWLLLGHYATDQEILLMTLLQSLMLCEFSIGAGQSGVDLMQIQLLYNVRHLVNDDLRHQLMAEILEARSASAMIDTLYLGYVSLNLEQDTHENSLLKPSLVKLKTTIDSACASRFGLFSTREKKISDNQLVKLEQGPLVFTG